MKELLCIGGSLDGEFFKDMLDKSFRNVPKEKLSERAWIVGADIAEKKFTYEQYTKMYFDCSPNSRIALWVLDEITAEQVMLKLIVHYKPKS